MELRIIPPKKTDALELWLEPWGGDVALYGQRDGDPSQIILIIKEYGEIELKTGDLWEKWGFKVKGEKINIQK